MKSKKLNRMGLINYIKSIQGIKQSHQDKNVYFIGDDKKAFDFQIDFVPQSKNCFFKINVIGLKSEADNMHDEIYNYLLKLELNRNMFLCTETRISLV